MRIIDKIELTISNIEVHDLPSFGGYFHIRFHDTEDNIGDTNLPSPKVATFDIPDKVRGLESIILDAAKHMSIEAEGLQKSYSATHRD